MRKNIQVIAGNLAETAIIRAAGEGRECLSLRVITNEEWTDDQGNIINKPCGHNVVKFGKEGQFTNFVEKCLQKGMPVYAEGITEKEMSEKDGIKYLNVTVNTTFDGEIQPIAASMRLNEQTIAGNLAEDSVVRSSGDDSDCLSFTVITNHSYTGKDGNQVETSCSHDVVKFGKKDKLTSLSAMLMKGAGVYLTGTTEKVNREHEGKKYLNVTLNATFKKIQITKYVTDKPA